jgi:uncharacterized membrane protein YedE/YeeE
MEVVKDLGPALAGGALIGLAASLVLLLQGRVAGVAGLFAGVFLPGLDARALRFLFLVGLVIGGLVVTVLAPSYVAAASTPGLLQVVLGGLLVGYGAQLGSGCTSGHGVCGIARLSLRSLLATATFVATGMLTVAALRALGTWL